MKLNDPNSNKFSIISMYILYKLFLSRVPFSIGGKIRYKYLKTKLRKLGRGSSISTNIHIINPDGIMIEEKVGIARDVVLDGRGSLFIGTNSLIGFETAIITSSHNFERTDIPIKDQGMRSAPVKIGDNCWIGARVIVLPGVTIGNNSIVGANSVVTKDIPDLVIAAGVPCKVIKKR